MRLKKLILHGFKSFADRTEFVFDSPITGIVGPNGCGKSNVVDAFKWVLGEQSAKSLRGEAMLDVIFNGSGGQGGRKPAGMAEVTLVFDNPAREDGSRTLALEADEVAVGRRLYRDATSEYTVNNHSSRLKDIRELFLDTGVGADAYSVIEQGRVAAMLDANPAERRVIFEEAAGISKYKVKKKEAQRKLEKVDQNLLRVNDIVEEVEKRLRSVKVQAGRARTFQEHSTRLRELRLQYALQEYHTQQGQLGEFRKQQDEAQFRLDDLSADLQRGQEELAEQRQQQELLAQKKQSTEYELVQARAAMQSARQKQQYAAQQLEQMAEQLAGYERDKAENQEKLASAQAALESESAALERLNGELAEAQKRIEQRQGAFHDGQLELNQLNRQIEQHKAGVLDAMRQLARINSRLGGIEIERKNIVAQQAKLTERGQVIGGELEKLEAARAELQRGLDAALEEIGQRQSAMEEKKQASSQLGEQIAQAARHLGAAREHRSGLLSRQKVLADMDAKREGVSEGVKSILRQPEKFPFIHGLVADRLRVDVEHAHVIEAALDGRDQWLVADGAEATVAAAEAFEELEGRVNVVSNKDEIENPASSLPEGVPLRLAIDLVRFEPADEPIARRLLGRTAVVDDLAGAMQLHREGAAGWRYVTLGGQVVEADGTLRLGPLTAAMGLLSRQAELEALALQIAETDQRIESLSQQLSSGNQQAKQIEQEHNALRNEVYQLNTRKVELSSTLSQNGDKQNALKREQPLLEKESAQLGEQSRRLDGEQETLSQRRIEQDQRQAEHQQQAEALAQRHSELNERIKQWAEELTAARVQLGQVQEKQLGARQQVRRHESAVGELSQQIARIEQSAKGMTTRRQSIEQELEQSKYAESQLQRKQGELEASGRALGESLQSIQRLVSDLSAGV
jgi:chromosome segregation protein